MRRVRRNTAIIDVERALKIASIRSLTRKNAAECDRVYFGHETCERLLPDKGHFRQSLNMIRRDKLKFSLLTPPATECGLRRIRSLLPLLCDEDEVVINDYGVLNMVATEFKNPIMIGRILGRIIVPTLAALRGNAGAFRRYLSLLAGRVRGVEVDSFNAPLIDAFMAEKMFVSLYRTRMLWTTTKRCAFNSRAGRLRKFSMCEHECLKCRAIIENVAVQKKFLLSGNAIWGLEAGTGIVVNRAFFKREVFEPRPAVDSH